MTMAGRLVASLIVAAYLVVGAACALVDFWTPLAIAGTLVLVLVWLAGQS